MGWGINVHSLAHLAMIADATAPFYKALVAHTSKLRLKRFQRHARGVGWGGRSVHGRGAVLDVHSLAHRRH